MNYFIFIMQHSLPLEAVQNGEVPSDDVGDDYHNEANVGEQDELLQGGDVGGGRHGGHEYILDGSQGKEQRNNGACTWRMDDSVVRMAVVT
jgi:hypothetical protein